MESGALTKNDQVKRKPWKQMTSEEKRARRAQLRAERAVWLRDHEEQWRVKVAAYFGYLETEYGFHIAEVNASSAWETYLRYESSALAVKVSRSVEFDSAELWLIRLVDGRVPKYPVFINPDTPINYVMLDRIVRERAPQESEQFHSLRGLSDEQIVRTLMFLATSLRAHADDVLRGDFAIFDVIAEQLHHNAREHPQEIKVWLPDTAQPGEERPLVETLHSLHPQQPIAIGHYSTKKRAKGDMSRKRRAATRSAPTEDTPSEP